MIKLNKPVNYECKVLSRICVEPSNSTYLAKMYITIKKFEFN